MIKDERKTKSQLIEELSLLRQKNVEGGGHQERRMDLLQTMRSIINASPLPILVLDKNQKALFLSSKFEDLFGYDREEIPTLRDWWRISYPDRSNGNGIIKTRQDGIEQALKDGRDIDPIETGVICKDGAKRYIEFRFIAMGDRYLMICNDQTDARRTEDELAQANEKLKVWICELEMQNSRMNLLRRMGEAFHACRSIEDALPVIKQYGPQLFPKTNGSLYTLDEGQGKMRAVVKWGNYADEDTLIVPEDCEALRIGKPVEKMQYLEGNRENAPNRCVCGKDNWFGTSRHMCIPMWAAGEAQGLLHLGFHDEDNDYERGVKELALVVTEQMALSLANLKLQETLRAQAIRDPLTKLFNRRYMEECLDREFHRAERRQHPISIIMADIDHFKLFNDTYGHDAGDVLLKLLSAILQKSVRKEDIICRFGGEEFVLIMPDMPLDVAIGRASALREMLKDARFDYEGQDLGAVTISLGVAVFPDHGKTPQKVLKSADDALYRAKNNGRDRVEVAASKRISDK